MNWCRLEIRFHLIYQKLFEYALFASHKCINVGNNRFFLTQKRRKKKISGPQQQQQQQEGVVRWASEGVVVVLLLLSLLSKLAGWPMQKSCPRWCGRGFSMTTPSTPLFNLLLLLASTIPTPLVRMCVCVYACVCVCTLEPPIDIIIIFQSKWNLL